MLCITNATYTRDLACINSHVTSLACSGPYYADVHIASVRCTSEEAEQNNNKVNSRAEGRKARYFRVTGEIDSESSCFDQQP